MIQRLYCTIINKLVHTQHFDMSSRRQAAAILLIRRRRWQRQNQDRAYWVHSILEEIRALGEYYRLVQGLKLDDVKFYQYLRMSKELFSMLLNLVGPGIAKRDTSYSESIGPEQRLAICLR